MLLSTLGYHKKALKQCEFAFQIDPLNAPISYSLSYVYYNNNQAETAIAQAEKTIELDPDFGDALNSMAWMYLRSNQYDKAIEIFNKILDEPTNHLDADTVQWLQDELSASNLTIIFVTHDRYFLDALATRIVELDFEKLFFFPEWEIPPEMEKTAYARKIRQIRIWD